MSELVLLPSAVRTFTPGVVPKLKVPFRITGTMPRAELVQQDSLDEIAQCVYAVLATQVGHRAEEPEFGIPEQLFRKGGADLEEIRAGVGEWEPRAEVLSDAQFEGVLQRVRVRVGT